MVYSNDLSRAFDTDGIALLLLLGCRGFIIPPPVRTSVNQGLRRPPLLQSPTPLRFPWPRHRRGASSGNGKNLPWRTRHALGKAISLSALTALMTFSQHVH